MVTNGVGVVDGCEATVVLELVCCFPQLLVYHVEWHFRIYGNHCKSSLVWSQDAFKVILRGQGVPSCYTARIFNSSYIFGLVRTVSISIVTQRIFSPLGGSI